MAKRFILRNERFGSQLIYWLMTDSAIIREAEGKDWLLLPLLFITVDVSCRYHASQPRKTGTCLYHVTPKLDGVISPKKY